MASTSQRFMDVILLSMLNLLTFVWIRPVNGDIYVKNIFTNHTVEKYQDVQSSFGLDFPNDGLEGWLVYASPDSTACSPVYGPPVNETKCDVTTCNYILLIARGGKCEFSDKVLAAQNSGYVAAIVHNFPGNNSEADMQSCANGSLVNIPSTFVGYSDGMELRQFNYTHRKYIIKIVEDDTELKLFLWPFAVVVGICFLVFVVFMLVKLLRDHTSKKQNILSKKNLKKIPVRKFKKGDYYDTCAICLDEYEEGEKIRVLPCDHVYHMKCIDPWLTKNKKTCPVCKRRVIPGKDADSESDTEAEDGHAPTGESENTPLLNGSSGHPRSQSHGSISDTAVTMNPSESVGQSQGNGSTVPLDSDQDHGAVGGEGISDRYQRPQTLLSLAGPSVGNIQERDERSSRSSERKQRRINRARTNDDDEEDDEEEDGAGVLLVGSTTRTDRREKRKPHKDKKVEIRNNQGNEATQRSQEEAEDEDNNNQHDHVNTTLSSIAEPQDVQIRVDDVDGCDNPSYSTIPEVVPVMGPRRTTNDVVSSFYNTC